jgi:hypothetical protein
MMRMINKKTYIGLALLITLVVVGIVFNNRNHHYKVVVIKSEQGWGYDILNENKIIIHQPYMPAVNGDISFGDKYSARKTGLLVVRKLENNLSPRISLDELNSQFRSPVYSYTKAFK